MYQNEPTDRLPLFLATLNIGDTLLLDTIPYTVTHLERGAGFIHLRNDRQRPYLLEIPDAIGLPNKLILSSNGGKGRPVAPVEVTSFDAFTPVRINVTEAHTEQTKTEVQPECPIAALIAATSGSNYSHEQRSKVHAPPRS